MSERKLVELVENFKNGDASKFEDIYLETNNKLYNFIFSVSDSLNEEDCYEILQETYIVVNNKIHTLSNNKAFNSWMYTIARNKTLRYLEKSKREVLLSDDNQFIFENQYETDEDFMPEEILDSKEKQGMILNVLNLLPKEQKDVIFLRYYNGLSVKEIASELNISEGTVKSRLNYGRKKIEKEVIEVEKKGTKLYCSSLPIIVMLLIEALSRARIPKNIEQEMLKNITTSKKVSLHNNETVNNDINKMENISTRNKSVKGFHKAVYKKIIICGTSILLLGNGAVIYSNLNKNDINLAKNIEENVDISKENIDKTDDSLVSQDTQNEIRYDISEYESSVNQVYERVKFNNFMGKDISELLEMDDFINNIELVSDGVGGYYYDSTYLIWANDIIKDLMENLNSVIKRKEEIESLDDLNKVEKETLNKLNEKLNYFINNQEKLNKLNDKVSLVISYGKSDRAVEEAKNFKNNFEKYRRDLEKLKNF